MWFCTGKEEWGQSVVEEVKRNSCAIKFLIFSFCSAGFSAEAQTESPDFHLDSPVQVWIFLQHRHSCGFHHPAWSGDDVAKIARQSKITQLWPLTCTSYGPASLKFPTQNCATAGHLATPGPATCPSHRSECSWSWDASHEQEQLSPVNLHFYSIILWIVLFCRASRTLKPQYLVRSVYPATHT